MLSVADQSRRLQVEELLSACTFFWFANDIRLKHHFRILAHSSDVTLLTH